MGCSTKDSLNDDLVESTQEVYELASSPSIGICLRGNIHRIIKNRPRDGKECDCKDCFGLCKVRIGPCITRVGGHSGLDDFPLYMEINEFENVGKIYFLAAVNPDEDEYDEFGIDEDLIFDIPSTTSMMGGSFKIKEGEYQYVKSQSVNGDMVYNLNTDEYVNSYGSVIVEVERITTE